MNYRQNFSIPETTIIYYIAKNPSTPKVYQKLVQSCKYFKQKNQILILHCLIFSYDRWFKCSTINGKTCAEMNNDQDNKWKPIDLKAIKHKIWVANRFEISDISEEKIASLIFPKKFKSNVTEFRMWYQTISINQLLLIGSSAKLCSFDNFAIKKDNGSEASLIEIIQCFPLLETFAITPHPSYITSENIKKLSKTLLSSNIKKFYLCDISEEFDIETFYHGFLKINKIINICFYFNRNISEAYKQRLRDIVNDILVSKSNDFWPPIIHVSMEGKKGFELMMANLKYPKNVLKQ